MALGAGCGPATETLVRHVGPPEGSGSWVLALPQGDGYELLHWAEGLPARSRSDEPEAPVVALRPRLDLEALGLDVGPMPSSDAEGLAVFEHADAFALDPETLAWRRLDGVPEAFAGYRLETACPRLGPGRTLWRQELGRLIFAASLDEAHALIQAEEGLMVATATAAWLVRLAPNRRLYQAVVLGDTLWAMAARGVVLTGPPTLPLQLQVAETRAVTVGGTGPEDYFLVGYPQTEVRHVDHGVSTPVGRVANFVGMPIGVGPGEAVVRSGADSIFRFTDEEVRTESTRFGELTALGRSDGLGPVAGSDNGDFQIFEDGGWRRLPGPVFGWWTLSVMPMRAGFMGLLASGSVIPYRGELPCPDLNYRGAMSLGALVPVQGGFLLVSYIDGVVEIVFIPMD